VRIYDTHTHAHTHTHTHTLLTQEGMANMNIDHLLLNILMWESGQKICFLLVLALVVLELVVLPLLAGLQVTCSPFFLFLDI